MAGVFEINRRSGGGFGFNLKAANDQVVLSSQGYKAKSSCRKGIESVRKHSVNDANFTRLAAADGRPYFTLKAANGKVIGQSQMYADASGRDNGIQSVATNAPTAAVEDLTT
jgi:uncharacterized protein YegP (UPF0339 family)